MTAAGFLIVGMVGGLAAMLVLFVRARDVRHFRREKGLENAVRERTDELERERSRERSRNRILEMLVANQSLGTVLDHVAQFVTAESPSSCCAVLLRQGDRVRIGAAPGAPLAMIEALTLPHAVPFEVWRGAAEFGAPLIDPAWRAFISRLKEPLPVAIRSRPIGHPERPLGALLLFAWKEGIETSGSEVIDQAPKLARIAIEHSRYYDQLNFQAHHDGLTGLPNRILFELRLAQSLHDARHTNGKVAVLYIDLDRFKQINDTMSHRIGDLYLAEIAVRMRQALRPGDTVARIGGDEFNVLLNGIEGATEAQAVAERLLEVLRRPAVLEGHSVQASASIGLAVFPDDGVEAEDLQRDADAAMYCAKGLGRDRVQVFGTRNSTLDRVRMEGELRKALRDNRFVVYYQPKVDAQGGLAGMEALTRWNHPEMGPIAPNDFIPLAEESGLIVPLGAWVLDEVCRQINAWREVGLGLVPVAVNVSTLQICRPDYAAEVEECLRRRDVPPQCIELELTESLLIGSGEETEKQMRYLRGLGIRFSIDDFGTGFSSLSYLHRLQVDAIKLDRSFVKSIDTDDGALRLVQAMIGVAQGLGLSVIAEGVETEEQRWTLIAAGCPTMQGYLFSRPCPAAEIECYLRSLRASDSDDLARFETALNATAKSVEISCPV